MGFESKDSEHQNMGHMLMECMQKRPNAVCQIDAATGESETNISVLSRSIRLARCIRNSGLRPGDVLSLEGKNHLDLHIPFYAAILNGLPISGVDPTFQFDELKTLFNLSRPKIAFCDKEKLEVHKNVISALGLDTKVVTFGFDESSMEHFLQTYDTNEPIEEFAPAEFDLDKIFLFLISTSGTLGKLKLAAIKQAQMIYKINAYVKMIVAQNNDTNEITLNLSPANWISGFYNAIGLPLLKSTKLQTSDPDNFDHLIDMINKYKPVRTLVNPSLITALLSRKDDVNLTCFRNLTVTGAKAHPEILAQFKALLHKDAVVMDTYGMTETLGPCLTPNVGVAGSCGRRMPFHDIKLIDPDSGKEITEPNTPGECWVKGIMFSEYYNDPEETANTFTEDGFFKTGDLLYFDENHNFYYVDRLKGVIKFRKHHILPSELEEVIHSHPAVRDVCVCGIPNHYDRQRPVACVVKRAGCSVTEQEIKDLVAEKLCKYKELSGGVVFLDELPKTSTGKIARAKLLDMILLLLKE